MDDQLLKGNFEVKKPVVDTPQVKDTSVREELKKRALASVGGSMVYMERTDLTWDGDQPDATNRSGKNEDQ